MWMVISPNDNLMIQVMNVGIVIYTVHYKGELLIHHFCWVL